VQSQVKLVPEKVPEKGSFGAERSGSGEGLGADPAEVFPALGLTARCGKICKNKKLRLLGISPKLICSRK